MKLVYVGLGVAAIAAGAGVLVACNGLLGISAATEEAAEAEAGADCPTYCTLMDQNCNWHSNYGEYFNKDVCLAMCPLFDSSGAPGRTNDNTLGCRIYYAQQAASDPAKNCSAAGLLGGGVCVTGSSACQNFCSEDVPFCQDAGAPSYASIDECNADCEADGGYLGYPYVREDGGDIGAINSGNTLNCRTWHLNNAYSGGSAGKFHCPHTQLKSGPCAGPVPDGGTF